MDVRCGQITEANSVSDAYSPIRPTAPPYHALDPFSIFSMKRIAHTLGAPKR
jgi:hypothetical protein